jgi:hypothetical protein
VQAQNLVLERTKPRLAFDNERGFKAFIRTIGHGNFSREFGSLML